MPSSLESLLNAPYRYYIRKHAWRVGLGLTWLFLTNLMETTIPWLVGRTLDQITAGQPVRTVAVTVGYIIGITLFLSLFRYLWRFFWSSFHHRAAEDLRNRLFAHMSTLGPSFFRSRKIGELISLISNDVNSFRMGIGPGLLILFDGIFMIGLILPMMIHISPTWTWQCLALMPFVPFVVNFILTRLHKAFHVRQGRFASMSGSAQETISGIRVIKSFAREEAQSRQFNIHSEDFRTSCNRVSMWDSIFGPALELPVALGSVLLILVGAHRVVSGEVTLGEFFAFYQYIQRMIWPMSAIGFSMGHVQESRASFKRIRDVLETKPDILDQGQIEIEHIESIEVKNLSFRYPGAEQDALSGISFRLEKGERLGVVGKTGSGKSTFIEILTRQYPVSPSTVFVNEIPIEKIRLKNLRKLIGVVPQEAFLFSRAVSENIALGLDNWELSHVQAIAGQVQLNSEIERFNGGYSALIGERGVNLSGGQKQRMTLARALAREAEMVILDDSLSAVDAKTEALILSQLSNELRKTTSIVISHRLASVKDATKILVLNQGRQEALGHHAELLQTCSTYRHFSAIQSDPANAGASV